MNGLISDQEVGIALPDKIKFIDADIDENGKEEVEAFEVDSSEVEQVPIYLNEYGDKSYDKEKDSELVAIELRTTIKDRGDVTSTIEVRKKMGMDGSYVAFGSYSGRVDENPEDYDHSDEASSDSAMRISKGTLDDIEVTYFDED